jgi:hypothetical protein
MGKKGNKKVKWRSWDAMPANRAASIEVVAAMGRPDSCCFGQHGILKFLNC